MNQPNNRRHQDTVKRIQEAMLALLDEEANRRNAAVISAPDSGVTVRVIPTDEELGIARRTFELV